MKHIAPFAIAAVLLAACSDDKPSNSLFEKTINQYSESQGLCLPLVLNVQNPNSPDSFSQAAVGTPEIKVAAKDRGGNDINKTALKQLDILEKEDFYEKSKEKIPAARNNEKNIEFSVYSLTEKGQKQTRAVSGMPHFCIGRQKVEKVNWYTEPSPSKGMTVSRVSYQARFVPEKWVGGLLKAGGSGKLPVEETRVQTATLVKTSEGWKDSRELR